MPKWLKIEKADDGPQSRARREPVAKQPDAITIGPGAIIGGLVTLAALAAVAYFVTRGGLPFGPAGESASTNQDGPVPLSGGIRTVAEDLDERLAAVDGRDILRREVDAEYVVQRFLQRALQGQILDESKSEAFRRDLLDRLVDRELLKGAADEAGITVDDARYATEMPTIGPGFGAVGAGVTTDMIRDAVVNSEFGLDDTDFRRWAESQIRSRMFLSSPSVRDYAARFTESTGRAAEQLNEEVVATVRAETSDVVFVIDGVDVRPVREGDPAPEIVLDTPDGQSMSLSSLRGTPVMVNFWATWCAPCQIEMPLFINAQETHGDGLVVLGVNSQEDPATVTNYVNVMGITFPVILDRDGKTSLVYRVRALPTTFFVDADGIVVRAHRGAIVSRPQLRPMLEEIMGATGATLPQPGPAFERLLGVFVSPRDTLGVPSS